MSASCRDQGKKNFGAKLALPSGMSASPSRSSDLTRYLDAAGMHHRMTAEEERAAARGLVEARRACWVAALACPSRLQRACKDAGIDEVLWTDAAQREALVSALDGFDPERATLERLAADEALGQRTRDAIRTAQREYCRLRNRFMCHNLRLVVVVAKRFGRMHLPLADRVQEGNLGLLKAIDRFDPERGTRFSTYAAWWIRHMVTRALMKHGRTVRVPGHLHVAFNKVRKARPALAAELGRNPTNLELAERTGVPVERVAAAVEAMELRSITLDAPVADPDGRTLGETIPDEGIGEWTDRVERNVDVPLATRALGVLDEKALRIVQHRYGLDDAERKTLRELGKDYGVSRERIRQLQVRALDRLRTSMEESLVPSIALA